MASRPKIKIVEETVTASTKYEPTEALTALFKEQQLHAKNKLKKDKKIKKLRNKNNKKAETVDEDDDNIQQTEENKEVVKQQAASAEKQQEMDVEEQVVQQETANTKARPKLAHLSICIPDSIISIPQSSVLRAYLLSQIARVCSVFMVDEIIVVHDYTYTPKSEMFSPVQYVVRNLQYLQTPQYLRKHLFDIHADLKNAGLMNPLECHHHLKTEELCKYREGVVIERPVKEGSGSWVDIGLRQQAKINYVLPAKTRVTVKLSNWEEQNPKFFEGEAVSRSVPRQEEGFYWGYNVRLAHNLKSVFKSSPSFDLKVLINHHDTNSTDLPVISNFKKGAGKIPDGARVLLFFSGYEPLESLVENDQGCKLTVSQAMKEFDYRFLFETHGVKQLRTQQQLFIVLNKLHGSVDRF